MTVAQVFVPGGFGLGEGPVPLDDNRFLMVDIHAGSVLEVNGEGLATTLASFDHSVGSVASSTDGDLLVSGPTGVFALRRRQALDLPNSTSDMRMNDGKSDPVGRFVGGTMAEPPRDGVAGLWSFSGGEATQLLDDITISNGLCWSREGTTLFYVDTPTQRVDGFDYDLATGSISNRRTVVRVDEALGSPDGMTIDAEGGLWVALWGGSAVHRYSDGELTDVVEIPTPFVTSVAFVGRRLVVTTAAEPAPDDPLAGHVLVAEPGVRGGPTHRVDLTLVFGSAADDPASKHRSATVASHDD